MNFKDRLPRRPSIDGRSARSSLALPRFSFEGHDRSLVSTERLFQHWQDEETQYDAVYQHVVEEALRKEQDIIVCAPRQTRIRSLRML
jgi:hypothetical protein